MSASILLNSRDTRVLPAGLEIGTHAAHQLSTLIHEHFQKRAMGSVLKIEGEETASVYLVLSGWMCASKSMMDGHRQIVDIVLPGGILEPASAHVETSAVEIEALTDVTYAAIPRKTWFRLVNRSPDLGEALQREVAASRTRMSERMLRLGKGDAESIIAFVLLELWLRSTGPGVPANASFHIPMTQQQLGDLCGLSAVHICRTLRRLKRNGVLEVRNHMDVTILDMDALADIAEIDPDFLQKEIVPGPAVQSPRACG